MTDNMTEDKTRKPDPRIPPVRKSIWILSFVCLVISASLFLYIKHKDKVEKILSKTELLKQQAKTPSETAIPEIIQSRLNKGAHEIIGTWVNSNYKESSTIVILKYDKEIKLIEKHDSGFQVEQSLVQIAEGEMKIFVNSENGDNFRIKTEGNLEIWQNNKLMAVFPEK